MSGRPAGAATAREKWGRFRRLASRKSAQVSSLGSQTAPGGLAPLFVGGASVLTSAAREQGRFRERVSARRESRATFGVRFMARSVDIGFVGCSLSSRSVSFPSSSSVFSLRNSRPHSRAAGCFWEGTYPGPLWAHRPRRLCRRGWSIRRGLSLRRRVPRRRRRNACSATARCGRCGCSAGRW